VWQTDGRTDGQTHDNSIYRAGIASCGYMSHVTLTLSRVICPPYIGTWYSLHVYKIWPLYSLVWAVPKIWLVPTKILNGLCDLTTPLSGMICHPRSRTCYQPADQILSLYFCPLQNNKRPLLDNARSYALSCVVLRCGGGSSVNATSLSSERYF